MKKETKKTTTKVEEPKFELIRLNKFLSHNSNYSRREADKLIEEGKIRVNNKVVTDLATKVKSTDKVEIGKKLIKEEKNKLYTVIVYNKPKGEIVSKKDPQGRKTIYDGLEHKYKHFLSVGRLDYSSEGLLLLSDSVDIVNALMHSDLERVYKIKLNGLITPAVEQAMQSGITIEDATSGAYKGTKIKSMSFAPFLAYDIQTNGTKHSKIKVVINEGKNRELRRFFAHFNLDVLDLKRLEYGGISLNNLPTGKSRYLTKEEYKNLRIFMNEDDRSIQ
ncbi:pseudouridine synthase [Aliarcobacter butzleri]